MGQRRRPWRERFGLQARMTASYVVLTAAAVIVVEAIAIAISIPGLLADQDLTARVSGAAGGLADRLAQASLSTAAVQLPPDFAIDQRPPITLTLVLTPDGQVLASSDPARYSVGVTGMGAIPSTKVVNGALLGSARGLISDTASGKLAWALVPVVLDRGKSQGLPPGAEKNVAGYVLAEAPVPAPALPSFESEKPLLITGLIVLLLALPVGAVFGFLTTRGLVRRLEQAVDRERALVEKSARLAERSRISRELHDSISQDLFSLSLLAGGLEKALPADSPVRSEVSTLAETVQSTNREMRALLLELRPSTLEEKGLIPALEELAAGYAQRFGVRVDADLEPVPMAPAAELAALRIAQEGLANAVKHAQASTIRLALHRRGPAAEVMVADDGRGFDPEQNGVRQGLGLRLMRERVDELGGSLRIDARSGHGTVVYATLPVAGA